MSIKSFNLSSKWRYLGIVLFVSILMILPIAYFGIPSGKDLPQHFQFANAYYESLTSGDGFPSWSARENFGYGSIGIRFYPPMAYYVLATFRIICGNWFDAAWLSFAFWMFLGCGGVYFWARCWLNEKYSAVAAVFYAVAPYHLNQLYISFIYADFAGAAILPYCFAFQTKIFQHGKNSDVLGLAFFYAILILTHLPSAIIGSICLAVYALILLEKKNAVRQIFKSGIAAFLGLAASSYYWLAMATEMSWLNHAGENYQSGHYYFGNRFFPTYIFSVAHDIKESLFLGDIFIAFGLLFLATALIYIFYRRRHASENNKEAKLYRTVLPLGLFAVFMFTPLSYPVWKIITPLQKIQFPLRFMSVAMMCGVIVTASAIYFMVKGGFFKKRAWLYASILFVATLSIIDFVYNLDPGAFDSIDRPRFESEMRELPDKQNYVFWWSVWSKEEALKIKEKVVTENRATNISEWKPEQRNFTVEAGSNGFARIATFYYPNWKAEVNHKSVTIEKDENGAMLIPLPAEKATVNLYFQEPAPVKIASYVSILAWIFIFFAFLFLFWKNILPTADSFPQLAKKEEFNY